MDLYINLMLQTETRCRLNGLVNVKASPQRIISLNVVEPYLWTHIYPNGQFQHNWTVYIFTQDLTLLLFWDKRGKFTSVSIRKYQTSFNDSFKFLFYPTLKAAEDDFQHGSKTN